MELLLCTGALNIIEENINGATYGQILEVNLSGQETVSGEKMDVSMISNNGQNVFRRVSKKKAKALA